MDPTSSAAALDAAVRHAHSWLATVNDRPVAAPAGIDELVAAFAEPLPDGPTDPVAVVDLLAERAQPGLAAMDSPRFFGFVLGGTLPAALGADVLSTAWDQNAGLRAVTPAVAAIEEVAAGWLKQLLRLPGDASVGFVTGGMMANASCLLAARDAVLRRAGWDVVGQGLFGAPPITVVVPDERHATIDLALRYLGLGVERAIMVPTDDQGRVLAGPFSDVMAGLTGPAIVTLAAGNVNTGAFDDFATLLPIAHRAGAWVHIDGAFGLWAAATPSRRGLVEGVAAADSWATDAHKWLNVPYDCGVAVVADAVAHRTSFQVRAAYLVQDDSAPDPMELVPEFSRRARGVPTWAALRSLGVSGVAELGENLCAQARRFATALAELPGVDVLNDVVLNQVLVRLGDPATTRRVLAEVLDGGVAYFGPSTFKGEAVARISVCNAGTTAADVDATVAALAAALRRS